MDHKEKMDNWVISIVFWFPSFGRLIFDSSPCENLETPNPTAVTGIIS